MDGMPLKIVLQRTDLRGAWAPMVVMLICFNMGLKEAVPHHSPGVEIRTFPLSLAGMGP